MGERCRRSDGNGPRHSYDLKLWPDYFDVVQLNRLYWEKSDSGNRFTKFSRLNGCLLVLLCSALLTHSWTRCRLGSVKQCWTMAVCIVSRMSHIHVARLLQEETMVGLFSNILKALGRHFTWSPHELEEIWGKQPFNPKAEALAWHSSRRRTPILNLGKHLLSATWELRPSLRRARLERDD